MVALAITASTALLPLAASASSDPSVLASSYRFDFGALLPGDTRAANVTLYDPANVSVVVRLTPEGNGPAFVEPPASVPIPAFGSANVTFTYRVPLDAPPGNHGELLQIRPQAEGSATSGASALGVTSIVFTSRTLGVGIEGIEAPLSLAPGGGLAGRVLVVSTWNTTENVTVALALVGADGAPVGPERALGTAAASDGNVTAFPFDFGNATLPAGNATLVARIVTVEPSGAPIAGGAFRDVVAVGTREVTLAIAGVEPQANGAVLVHVRVTDTGTLPVAIAPFLHLVSKSDPNATTAAIGLDPMSLAPGEAKTADATIRAAPGDYTIVADARATDGAPLVTHPATGPITLAAPALSGAPSLGTRILSLFTPARLLGGAALLLVAGLAVVAARRARRSRVVAQTPHGAPLPPLTRAAAGAAPRDVETRGVAIFVDLASVVPRFPDPAAELAGILAECADGRVVSSASIYVAARDAAQAERALAALSGLAGAVAVVRVGRRARDTLALRLALDVAEAAREGHRIVLVSHDARFAELGRSVARAGSRLEVVGAPGDVPVALLEAADAVRPLREASPAPLPDLGRVHDEPESREHAN
ncbi:MAG: NYN domain-containing protein [Thermoplasmatota archaeon]